MKQILRYFYFIFVLAALFGYNSCIIAVPLGTGHMEGGHEHESHHGHESHGEHHGENH